MVVGGAVAALVLAWLVLVAALAVARPGGGLLSEALRILPDVLRLLRRLATDRTLPAGIRLRPTAPVTCSPAAQAGRRSPSWIFSYTCVAGRVASTVRTYSLRRNRSSTGFVFS